MVQLLRRMQAVLERREVGSCDLHVVLKRCCSCRARAAPRSVIASRISSLAERVRRNESIELRDCVHLLVRKLLRDRAHLAVDVVLAGALRELGELTLDVLGSAQRRGAELARARTVTGGARRNGTRRIPGEDQSGGGIGLPKRAAASKRFAIDAGKAMTCAQRWRWYV